MIKIKNLLYMIVITFVCSILSGCTIGYEITDFKVEKKEISNLKIMMKNILKIIQ